MSQDPVPLSPDAATGLFWLTLLVIALGLAPSIYFAVTLHDYLSDTEEAP